MVTVVAELGVYGIWGDEGRIAELLRILEKDRESVGGVARMQVAIVAELAHKYLAMRRGVGRLVGGDVAELARRIRLRSVPGQIVVEVVAKLARHIWRRGVLGRPLWVGG